MAKTILIAASLSFCAAVLMSHAANTDPAKAGTGIEARAATPHR
ncbi:hypothetical protein [Novosphingobium resinovorum]|jgi:hypothetical protein|uniref:Uncharacterized protein n=1 Tax=Novosphingobium resinovorum TaxID=158500 RepID=A0A031K3M6_9SPHN|nr:hypothetical protein [Novosphingobium resinovorum]EZP83212.1 hypothetical protein BV97_01318 [Novosphingobium resinovorum]